MLALSGVRTSAGHDWQVCFGSSTEQVGARTTFRWHHTAFWVVVFWSLPSCPGKQTSGSICLHCALGAPAAFPFFPNLCGHNSVLQLQAAFPYDPVCNKVFFHFRIGDSVMELPLPIEEQAANLANSCAWWSHKTQSHSTLLRQGLRVEVDCPLCAFQCLDTNLLTLLRLAIRIGVLRKLGLLGEPL